MGVPVPSRRRAPPKEDAQLVAQKADDILHFASGAGVTRDLRIINMALGWPKLGSTRPGVAWATPTRNMIECYAGDRTHSRLLDLVERGMVAESNRWNDGLIEYKVTELGRAVAAIRHAAIREARKVLA